MTPIDTMQQEQKYFIDGDLLAFIKAFPQHLRKSLSPGVWYSLKKS